ncbi:MAG: cyclopropane-fatty-acyl-phospholipid synthase family protein [Gammaproteobacteria bacterium]|jgi:cyclopropane-fatty-acyl-phospholipid synthase|nr:cyclopropane-fatty-acyl-phospholipid synthase family protein [Gammaproteobacteria bacterium]
MNTLTRSSIRASTSLGFLGNLAKGQLLKRLKALPRGYLEIEDGEVVHSFGDPKEESLVHAKMVIKDASAYRDIAFGGSLGGAEAYMLDKWSTPNMLELVRLMCINIDFLNQIDGSTPLLQRAGDRLFHWLNRNTEKQARDNISRHYDLSNDFFSLFLDPQMMYSAAIFEQPEMSLEEASVHKLEVICRKLELQAEDHLLEIGTGWGGLAIYAAKHYGCCVTTTTISREQYEAACRRVRDEGLDHRITVLFEDYRNLRGRFDKLVSVEMIEAVGHKYYNQYFRGCSDLLKADGLMLLQAITIPAQRYDYARRSVDFIQRYIFPGGSLPSHEVITSAIRANTDMVMVGMQEIGEDYARTLHVWRERFLQRLDDVRALGFDDYFIRMWHYYLCYCQGGFEERIIGTSQILFAKPQWRQRADA